METQKRTLLTIVSESAIERRLLEDIRRLGAHGYTLLEAQGGGTHGTRSAEDDQDRNIKIEVVCEREVAEIILEHLAEKYYQNYAMIGYLSEVEVIRAQKF